MIDEDLSDCDDQADIDYELRLLTNMSTEISTELSEQTDVAMANSVHKHLSDIFTDFAHDVDLSFYDTKGDSARLEHDMHIMDARQSNYSLNIPKQEYMHLAVANIQDNKTVSLLYDERCHTSRLLQADEDTIDSHSTGLFTAREPIHILEGMNQNFNVKLYMANSAVVLIIDTQGHDTSKMRVYSKGHAEGFSICDSLYLFGARQTVVRSWRIADDGNNSRAPAGSASGGDGDMAGFCSVGFPTQGPWQFLAYAPTANGTTTETVINVPEKLEAGELRIIRVKLTDSGALTPKSTEVSVTVTLDWKPGGTYHHDI